MGGSSYSDDLYQQRQATRSAAGFVPFQHDVDAKAGRVSALSPRLNIKGVKVRESRDSDAHPNSRAVAVMLDVTGSMAGVPVIIQKALPTLMGLLLRKAYIPDPQIMISATADATGDAVPIQVGQFESGVEIDDDINELHFGGGGRQGPEDFAHETHELVMYFLANHTSLDCFEKRGEKGYLFIISDEMYRDVLKKEYVAEHIGDSLEADVNTGDIFAKLLQTYEVFYIMPRMTMHFGKDDILAPWRRVLGERVLLLEEPSAVCELIASTIAVNEGNSLDSIVKDVKEASNDVAANNVDKALARYAGTVSTSKASAVSVPSTGGASGMGQV